jgi:hypothetical protein
VTTATRRLAAIMAIDVAKLRAARAALSPRALKFKVAF